MNIRKKIVNELIKFKMSSNIRKKNESLVQGRKTYYRRKNIFLIKPGFITGIYELNGRVPAIEKA